MKLIACLALFCLATTTFAAGDCNGMLLEASGYTKLNAPTTVSGLKFCKSLQNGQSCCPAEVINKFQEKAQEFADTMSEYAATRDTAMVTARDKVLPGLKQQFAALSTSVTALNQAIGMLPDVGESKAMLENLRDTLQDLIKGSNDLSNNLAAIKIALGTYQKARSTCVIELFKIQGAAYCLRCDPEYNTKGVEDGVVTLSDNTCDRVQAACYGYIKSAASQNSLLYMKNMQSILGNLAASITATIGGTGEGIDFNGLNAGEDSDEEMNAMPGEFPKECEKGNCPWICDSLLNGGDIVEKAVLMGGEAYDAKSKRVLPQQRKLAGGWEPEEDEAGFTVDFKEDPGNNNPVVPAGLSLLKASFVSIVGLVVALAF